MIQTTAWPLNITSDDFQATTHGVTWAIKFHEIPEMNAQTVHVLIKQSNNLWAVDETLDSGFDIKIHSTFGGDPMRWLVEYLIPALTKWLNKIFKAGQPPNPNIPLSVFQQAEALIKGLKVVANSDGTVSVSV